MGGEAEARATFTCFSTSVLYHGLDKASPSSYPWFMAYLCSECSATYATEGAPAYHRRRKHGDVQLTAEKFASLQSSNAQPETPKEVSMDLCPVCIHNSDARAKAAADLAVANTKLETLTTKLASMSQTPVHPVGLCDDGTCKPCHNAEVALAQQTKDEIILLFEEAANAYGLQSELRLLAEAVKHNRAGDTAWHRGPAPRPFLQVSR